MLSWIKGLLRSGPPVHGDLTGFHYLRGMAALLIVFDHVSTMMSEPKYFNRNPLGDFVEFGNSVSVDFLFALSGFIIVYISLSPSYEPKLKPSMFFSRRFARLMPFMWVMIAMYAALRLAGRGTFPYLDYVRSITLFPVGDVEPPQIWTLRYELLFYIVYAATFLSRRPLWFFAWGLAPLVVFFIAPSAFKGPGPGAALAAFVFNNINIQACLGVLVGLAYVKTSADFPLKPWAEFLVVPCFAIVFFAGAFISYDRSHLPEVLLIGVLCAACLFVACMVTPPRGPIGRFGKVMGDASYSLYLSHPAFISAFLGLFASHFHHAPDWLIISVTFFSTVAAGVVINRVVEDPVVAWSRSFFTKRPSQQPVVKPAE